VSTVKTPDLQQLRRYAIARSLFKPTGLKRAIARLGFVQADPMRAPARAQDLILAYRVKDYRVGELERRYPRLAVEECFFLNYGFLLRENLLYLYPRTEVPDWDARMRARAEEILAFVRARGHTRAKDVEAHFNHGRIKGLYWGANPNVSTHVLECLHYRGLLRVARRERGARVYESIEQSPRDDSPEARLARAAKLMDIAVRLYAPLPAASLGHVCGLFRYGAPQLSAEMRQVRESAEARYASARVEGGVWFWPREEHRWHDQVDQKLRWLAPFDPIVWDRRRFRLLWGWEYKFEAYVPVHRRRMGHYAMPMLWGEQMLGWANLSVVNGRLQHELGFVGRRPRGTAFRRALREGLGEMESFLAG